MAMPEMEAVKDAALKYDKKTLGRLAQLGQISATLAVMAGMMRDRIVQSEMKPSTKTVSQDVLPADSMGIEGFSDPTAAQQPVMRRAGGLTNIPVRDNMYEMAGGGIVAFQAGGATPPPSFANMYSGLTPDLEALAAARKAYMGDFPTESEEERRNRRREEQALRLMEAGLGIAGGTSESFAANLKGALPAIQGYGTDLATQRKEDLLRLAAERGEKGKVFEGVIGSREKAAQRESAENIAKMQASKASNMKQFAMDAIAAEEAVLGRPLTEAETAKIRSQANERYVTLTAALNARGLSAQASASRAETAAADVAAAPTRTAMQEVNDAISKRGTPQYDRYRAAKRKDSAALKEGKTTNFAEQEYEKLLKEAEARFPGGRGAATRSAAPAGRPSPPPGFIEE
jgi:hypothetical protein